MPSHVERSSDRSSELAELREQHRAVVGVLRMLGRAGGDLQPVLDIVAESATQPLCIDLSRAAGFNGAISLSGSDGLRVLQQPGGGSTGAVLVTGCATSPCALTAHSGARSDVLWIRAHA